MTLWQIMAPWTVALVVDFLISFSYTLAPRKPNVSGTDKAKKNFDNAHGLAGSNTDCGPKSWESLMTGRVW
jgi:hypothetical protein